jgi:hypothetical protein
MKERSDCQIGSMRGSSWHNQHSILWGRVAILVQNGYCYAVSYQSASKHSKPVTSGGNVTWDKENKAMLYLPATLAIRGLLQLT